ncbi:hypothetical protein P4S93_16905 [Aneurinibacillus thermoaerophilus]|uniref:hypothetical protein n=1 Tax=Aneurinibacillus thermoaerophilus TaxID=143495 RepID=UPI002E1F52DB|nr:hypothetical protein [Aneurinibacillus thermoaerophilus]MED0762416.1 hypothetical protein [Aneurinibacillus thermoaerophilus]
MKKSKFGGNYPLDVKKIAMQYPDFFVDQINETYWAYGRDVEATMLWLDKCRTGEAHKEVGIEFDKDDYYNYLSEQYGEDWGYTVDDPVQEMKDNIEESIHWLKFSFEKGFITQEQYENDLNKYQKMYDEIG